MDEALGLLAMLAVPGYWVLQYAMAKHYSGGWRIAALVPLGVMVPLLAYTAFAFFAGSNLWPLMLILASPMACVYLVIVVAIRAMT